MIVEREEELEGHGWTTSKIGPASTSIRSPEQLKTESIGVCVFQKSLICRPNGLPAV